MKASNAEFDKSRACPNVTACSMLWALSEDTTTIILIFCDNLTLEEDWRDELDQPGEHAELQTLLD